MDERGNPEQVEADLVTRYTALLEALLGEVSATLKGLCREVPGLRASTKKRPEEILSMLPRLLPLHQMSLLEIQYRLPGTRKRPGIRLWFEGPETRKRLRAVLFPDTRVWEVSYDLTRVSTELGTFLLEGEGIVARPSSAVPGRWKPDSDWREVLRSTLRTPLPFPQT